MTERDQQFFALYRQHRFEHQRAFYDSRRREFAAAQDESVWLAAVLMVFTAAAAALAAANVGGLKELWSVLAVAFPALGTALSAYNGLYAFERQAKLYGDAANALLRARAAAPDLRPLMDDATWQGVLRAYVQQVERILGGEQAQWGQLIGEIKPIAPETKPKTDEVRKDALQNASPTVTSIEPAELVAGSDVTKGLVLHGGNFVQNSVVLVNDDDRVPEFISSKLLKVILQPSDIAQPGAVSLAVRNPPPGGGTSAKVQLTVKGIEGSAPSPPASASEKPTLTITGLNPPDDAIEEGATAVRITGSGFVQESTVLVNGHQKEASKVTYIHGGELRVILGPEDTAAEQLSVKVVNPPPQGGESNELSLPVDRG